MINKQVFRSILGNTHDAMLSLTATKGEEYSRDGDQLANFKRNAAEAGITQEQAWLVLFNKHVDAIKSYVKTGKVLSEPIDARVLDAMLYLNLFRGMISERQLLEAQRAGN